MVFAWEFLGSKRFPLLELIRMMLLSMVLVEAMDALQAFVTEEVYKREDNWAWRRSENLRLPSIVRATNPNNTIAARAIKINA